MSNKPPALLVLPLFIQTKPDVYALLTEILQIEGFLYKAQVRKPGTKMKLPKTTLNLDQFAAANNRNILNHGHRMELAKFLRGVYKLAPVVNVSVDLNAQTRLIDGIVEWFRAHVHAQTLVQINRRTGLGFGCVLRIKHKTYDMTLGHRFDDRVDVLHHALNALHSRPTTTERRLLT